MDETTEKIWFVIIIIVVVTVSFWLASFSIDARKLQLEQCLNDGHTRTECDYYLKKHINH